MLFETGGAKSAIFDFGFAVVDEDVGAVEDEFAVFEATVHGSFATAFADGFDFFDVVGDLEEASGALETFVFLAEVEAKAVGDDGDVEFDGNVEKLVDLGGSKELGFVD